MSLDHGGCHHVVVPRRTVALVVLLVSQLLLSRSVDAAVDADPPFRSVYSGGDLILVHPVQSTAIFASVTVLSMALKFGIDRLYTTSGHHVRAIVAGIKSAVTAIALVQLTLLWCAFSFTYSSKWRISIEWVALCQVFLALGVGVTMTVMMVMLSVQERHWRAFEWASINTDANHDGDEQIFKLAQQYFLSVMIESFPGLRERRKDQCCIVFSAFVTYLLRTHVLLLTSCTPWTWLGLAALVIMNGARGMALSSVKPSYQAVSFIVGFGTILVAFQMLALVQLRGRMRALLYVKLGMGADGVQLPTAGGDSPRQRPKPGGDDTPTSGADCYLFGTLRGTLEVFKLAVAGLSWYVAVIIVTYVHLSFETLSMYAVLPHAFAIAVVAFLVKVSPLFVHTVFVCAALAEGLSDAKYRPVVEALLRGVSVDDVVAGCEGCAGGADDTAVPGQLVDARMYGRQDARAAEERAAVATGSAGALREHERLPVRSEAGGRGSAANATALSTTAIPGASRAVRTDGAKGPALLSEVPMPDEWTGAEVTLHRSLEGDGAANATAPRGGSKQKSGARFELRPARSAFV